MGCGTIVGLLLGGAGAGVSELANVNTRNTMNDTVNQELARNQAYQKQGSQVFNQSLAQSTPQAANQQIGQGQQQLAGLISNAQATPMSASMPSFGNVNTQTQTAKNQLSNTAAANIGGYSNYGLQQYLKDLQAQSQLGVINKNAQGWANILPAQLQQASQSQSGLSALGSLLGTGGLLAGLSGLGAAPAASTSSLTPFGATASGFPNAWMYPETWTSNFLGGM